MIDAGVVGETTVQGLARLSRVLDQSSPDLATLMEGSNDILRGLNLGQAKNDLRDLVLFIQQRHIDVVLIGLPKKSLFLNTHPMYKDLATELELVFDGAMLAELQATASLKSNVVHFNKMGYQKMSESIYTVLQERVVL
jgi:lysophospholipase L1-like esterase